MAAIAPTPGVLDLQLLLVRSTIDRARAAAAENSAIGSMTAMLLADIATETIAKAACQHLGIAAPDGANLAQVLGPLGNAVPAIATAAATKEAQRHRKNRNLIQHQGHVPDAQMVALSVADAERFCVLVVTEVFKRDFESINVVLLVRHHQLKRLLEMAITARRGGDMRSAIIAALAAFDFLHYTWARAIRLADGYDESHDPYRAATASPFLATAGIDLTMPKPDDENPYPTLSRMTLGVSVDELVRVQSLRDAVDEKLRKSKRSRFAGGDVDAVVDIVARAAWRLESAHPGLLEFVAPTYGASKPTRPRKGGPGDRKRP